MAARATAKGSAFGVLAAVIVLLSACQTTVPNSGLDGVPWSAMSGQRSGVEIIVPGTGVKKVNIRPSSRGTVYTSVRPSASEGGLATSRWQAVQLAHVPAELVDDPDRKSPFSEAVRNALQSCAPEIGTFASLAEWASDPDHAFRTGKLTINGIRYIQYVTHRASWQIEVSNTGRGYRAAAATAEVLGSIRQIPRSRTLRTALRITYLPVQSGGRGDFLVLPFDGVRLDEAVTARCVALGSGTKLEIMGPRTSPSDSGWFPGISEQPFNVLIEVTEEVAP